MATVRLSKKFSLQIPDYIRAAGLAALVSALKAIYDLLIAKQDIHWNDILAGCITVFLGYLIKNGLFEPAKVITTVDSNARAVNASEKIKEAI